MTNEAELAHEDKTKAGANAGATEPSQPDKGWPAKCVDEALQAHAVPVAVSDMLVLQLVGVARERALKTSELTALAQVLIARLDEAATEGTAP